VRDKVEKIDKLYQKNENQTKKQVEDLFTSIYNLFLFLGTNGNNKTRPTSKYKISMRLLINCYLFCRQIKMREEPITTVFFYFNQILQRNEI
jgi:hypothetical protein